MKYKVWIFSEWNVKLIYPITHSLVESDNWISSQWLFEKDYEFTLIKV